MTKRGTKLFEKRMIEQEFTLEASACDRIADLIMDFCRSEKVDGKDAIRYRISAEECLLYWLQKGCQGSRIMVRMGRQLMMPYIILQMDGDELNPYNEGNWEDPYYYHNILIGLNLEPLYSYESGRNRITFRMKRRSPGQLATMGIVILAAVLLGLFGQAVLPAGIRQGAVEHLVTPVYETFFQLISCIAGPMIFLSVVWGMLGVGDVSTFGKIGKKMIFRFARNDFLVAFCSLAFIPFFSLSIEGSGGKEMLLNEILKLILGIFPPNIVEPFQTSNTLQIVFLAIVVGITLLYLGRQTDYVVKLVGEINIIVQYIMRALSSLVPYVIFLIILNLIWSDSLDSLAGTWKLMLALLIGEIFMGLGFLLRTSISQKIRVSVLLKKALPAVLIGFTSASSAAALTPSLEACDKEYGMDSSVSGFGLPLSMVMQKAALALYFMVLAFYLADVSHVACSPEWVVTAALISGIMSIAVPPVPGGIAMAMSLMFAQLDLPNEALGIALTVNMFADFIITATDTLGRHMTLINLASSLGMLDRNVLEKRK